MHPKCPLDEFVDKRIRLSGEPKCVATKKVRIRIGSDLKHKGLTGPEYGGIVRMHGSFNAYSKQLLGKGSIQL